MKKIIYFPDFINLQRNSFYSFLEKGFINQFHNRKKIKNSTKEIEFIFYPENYKIKPPELSSLESILKGKSYTSKIFIPVQLINKKKKIIKIQWVLIANLPIMTKRGHFILNGAPRIVINQLIRNPGIYFHEISGKRPTYYADFISYRGTWLRIEIDKKKKIWAKMKKTQKFSILILLQSIGLTKQNIFQTIEYGEILENSFLKKNHPTTTGQALALLDRITNPKKNFFSIQDKTNLSIKMGYKFLFRKFLNPKNYNLSSIGRLNLNKKLGLSICETKRTLTAQDLLYGTDYLIKLNNGIGKIDDIDSLENRRIRASGEILENQIYLGIIRLEKFILEKFRKNRKNLTIKALVSTKPINGALKEFFGSSQLSQFMDQTNPLAELTHKRRVTSIGPNGVSRESAGIEIRGIHSTHYGRICPIETPEGQNAGLVNSITSLARINNLGGLETPFFKIHKGQILKHFNPIFLSAELEDNIFIAPIDIKITKLDFLPKKLILSRLGKNFKEILYKHTNFISISPIQMISIATSLIPFLEHDDGNRALMGSNMQRQAVPLLQTEKALVTTGLESRIISDSGHSVEAKITGYISYVGGGNILIQKGLSKKFLFSKKITFFLLKNISPFFQKNFQLKKIKKNKSLFNLYFEEKKHNNFSIKKKLLLKPIKKLIKNKINKKNEILLNFQRSNQETLLTHKPMVREGEWVQKGDFLADGSASKNGELALGKNLLISYMPWYGYNFEDAVLISERLVHDDIYTSIHIERFEIEIRNTNYGLEQITRNLPDYEVYENLHLNEFGIVKIGTFVKEGDILVGKLTPIDKKPLSPYEKLLYDIVEKEIPTVKDTSLRVPKGVYGKIINIEILDNNGNRSDNLGDNLKKIDIYIAEKRKIQVGDKISGRHGNKGIVSKILPKQDMPYLPDGTPIDIVLNPLGIPSRMNVGQVFECLFGLAAIELKEEYKILPFDEMFGTESSRSIVFSKLYSARLNTKKNWIFNPTFPGKIQIFDGYTGNPFDQHITVGYGYILKLIHLVDEKIHARSTGPYSLVTQQPLRGRSKHGGQRLGEMEVWALEGFGAAYTLQELLTIKSDDIKGREQVVDSILRNKPIQFGTPESFKVLVRELQSLCLKISVFIFNNQNKKNEIDILKLS